MKKRVIKIFGVFILIILAIYVFLHTPPVRGKVLKYLLYRVREATGAEVNAKSLHYNLMTWQFTLKDVTISKKDGKNKNRIPFFKAEQVTIDLPFPLSMKKSIHLEQINIVNPGIHYFIRPDGTDNFPFPVRKSASAEIPSFLIDSFNMENLHVDYRDRQKDLTVDIPGIDAVLHRLKQERHSLSVNLQNKGILRLNTRSFPITAFSLQALLDSRDIEIRKCSIRAAQNHIELLGRIKGYTSAAPVPDMTIHIKTKDFLLPEPAAASADGTASFTLNGFSLDRLRGKGDFRLFPRPGGLPLKGNLLFEIHPGKLEVNLQRMNCAGITIDGKLMKNPEGIKGNLVLDIPDLRKSLREVHELRIAAGFTREIRSALDTGISGRSVIRANIAGTMDSPQVSANFKSLLRVKKFEPVHLEGTISYAGETFRIEVDSLDIRQDLRLASVKGTLSLKGEIDIRKKKGRVDAAVDRLEITAGNRVLKNREPFRLTLDTTALRVDNLDMAGSGTSLQAGGHLPFTGVTPRSFRPLTLTAHIDCRLFNTFFPFLDASGDMKLNGVIRGTLSHPIVSGRLDLSGGKAAVKNIPASFENIDLHIELPGEGEEVLVQSFTFHWQGGTFSLTGKLPIFAPGFSLALSARGVNTQMAASLFPGEWRDNVTGSLDADVEIRGKHLDAAQLSGSARVYRFQLNVDGFPFRQQESATLTLENGKITVENLELSGPDSYLRGKGTLGLSGTYPLEAELSGQVHSRIMNGFWEDIAFSGTNTFHFLAKGDLSSPGISGEMTLEQGGIRHLVHHLYISGLRGKIKIEKDRIYIPGSIDGTFNGGTLKITGGAEGVAFHFRGVEMDIPGGLLWEAGGTLTLEPLPTGDKYRLRGGIAVSNGIYKETFNLGSRLYRYFHQPTAPAAAASTGDAAIPLDFDIDLYTDTPIRVENNISKGEISAALKLTGSALNPVPAGRADIKEGSEIYLGKNTFYIERGTMNFINPYQIEPELDIRARTQVSNTNIRLSISGTPRALSASFSSTPPLPESHIIALLASGKPMDSTSPSMLSNVGTRALTYLGSTVTGKIEQAVKQTLGLETVRIDGSLVAARENPGARFTLGHHLTPNLGVIFSQSLRQSQNRTWIVNYDPSPGINLQAARQDNNAYNLGINHEIQFGLKESWKKLRMAGKKQHLQKIRDLVVTGTLRVPENEIRKRLKSKKGKPFRFLQFREDLQRVRKFYHRRGYLNVEITTGKETDEKGKTITVFLDIDAGARVFLEFHGDRVPRRLQKKVKNLPIKAHSPEQLTDNIIRRLRLYFFKKRYYRPHIRAVRIADDKEKRKIAFHIDKGSRFDPLRVEYTGNRHAPSPALTARLKREALLPFILIRPDTIIRYLEKWYRQEGFLSVTIEPLEIRWMEKTRQVAVKVDIDEGPRFRVGKIRFEGNRFLEDRVLAGGTGLREGETYSPKKAGDAALSLESAYAEKGFYNTRVMVKPAPKKEGAQVDLLFVISENPQRRIREIRIRGNRVTRENIIRRELLFKTGDILDLKTINKTRKNLYDMAVFDRVTLEVIPEPGPEVQEPVQSCVIDIRVEERQPFYLKYGLQGDSETAVGIAGEAVSANVMGTASLFGASFLFNKLEQRFRIFSRFPYFPAKKLSTELFLFTGRKKETPSAPPVNRTGMTLQERLQLTGNSLLSFSYTFETYGGETSVNLGHLTATAVLDTRDNFLNAARGLFLSQSFQYAGKCLGSQMEFLRYLGQFNIYKALTSRWVSATSLHLGFGKALGQTLLPGERFFAGGSTTIRGFKHNGVGPMDPVTGEPEGGEALFIFKQELRFRLFRDMGAVLFFDMGNVYPVVSDFDPFDSRKAAGFGLRFNLYGLLLRLDWGFKLDRRPGESLSGIFFSIGQSF